MHPNITYRSHAILKLFVRLHAGFTQKRLGDDMCDATLGPTTDTRYPGPARHPDQGQPRASGATSGYGVRHPTSRCGACSAKTCCSEAASQNEHCARGAPAGDALSQFGKHDARFERHTRGKLEHQFRGRGRADGGFTVETAPTEITPLMYQRRRNWWIAKEAGVPVEDRDEVGWWMLQILLLVPVLLVLVGRIGLLLVGEMRQSLVDGGTAWTGECSRY